MLAGLRGKESIRHNKDIDRDRRIGKVGMYFSIGALINNEFQGSGSGADEISTFSIKHAFNIHLTLFTNISTFDFHPH